jgi:hypothetical protein
MFWGVLSGGLEASPRAWTVEALKEYGTFMAILYYKIWIFLQL